MKAKQFLILVLLAVVLGIIGLVIYRQQSSGWQHQSSSVGGKVFKDFQLNDVAKITVKSTRGDVHLERKDDGWVVDERSFPADFEQVSRLVRNLWELKPVQDVKAGPSQFGRLQLIEPAKDAKDAGTLVELQNASGGRIAALLLGKNFLRDMGESMGEGFPAGRYVLAEDGGNHPVLVSETFSDVTTEPERWIQKNLFEIRGIKSVTVSGTVPTQSWSLSKENEGGEWKLADVKGDEKLDPAKVPGFEGTFSSLNITDVLPADTKPESVGLDKPSIVTITTFDGFTYTFKVGKKENDNWIVQPSVSANIVRDRSPGKDEKAEDKKKLDDEFAAKVKELDERLAKYKKLENRIYKVPQYAFDSVFKDRSQLLADKPAPTPAPGVPPATSGTSAAPVGSVSVTTPPVSVSDVVAAPSPAPTVSGSQTATPAPSVAPSATPAQRAAEKKAPKKK